VNEYELYLLSPQAPPWRVAGLLYFTLLFKIRVLHHAVFYTVGGLTSYHYITLQYFSS